MIAEKLKVIPQEVPVATLQVTQAELDLLTALINEVNTNSPALDTFQIWEALRAVGGNTNGVRLEKTGTQHYEATFTAHKA